MPAEFMSAIAFLTGALVAMIASCQSVSKGTALQQEILKRGKLAQGRVIRIWRPPVFGSFTRVYRRRGNEPIASLPAIGAAVTVRYMPENPTKAVIAKLVSRFTD
jgi:hypothetical protein